MWFSSNLKHALCLAALAMMVLLFVAGCMSDKPDETDMPWAAPASWEGTMPLPSGFSERY